MHLNYCLLTAGIDCGENRHPQVVMCELGITYQYATPQSLLDSWWFWNCENLPAELPKFLQPMNLDPQKQVGWGIGQAQADAIHQRWVELSLRKGA